RLIVAVVRTCAVTLFTLVGHDIIHRIARVRTPHLAEQDAHGPLRPHRPDITCGAGWPLWSLVTLRPGLTCVTFRPLGPLRPLRRSEERRVGQACLSFG